jgi:predicted transcriptional regulator
VRSAKSIEVPVSAEEEFDLTEEQEAFIEASITQVERGEYVDGDEVLAELRRRRVSA